MLSLPAALPAAVPLPTVVGPSLPIHERWFVEEHPGGDWGFYFSALPLTLTAVMVVVAIAWRLVALRVRGPELPFLSGLASLTPWVPRLLGIHLGVSLLALAATGAFFSPAVDHLDGATGTALLFAEAVLGVWLVSGVNLRPAAGLVLAMGPALALASGSAITLAECANLAAVAGFLVFVPPGRHRYGAAPAPVEDVARGLFVLRLGVGIALIALAFTEKFTNPDMAVATVEAYPVIDVFSWVGIDLAPTTFVTIAGAVELLFGLLVISGAFPQVAVLVAMVPFNATLLVFGQTELVGHLPVYGVFLALLAYGSDPRFALHVRWLPGLRSRTGGRRVTEPAAEDAERPELTGAR